MTDSAYPLYLDSASFNPLIDLHSSSNGMQSWATAVGLREQDLFGTCLVIFLMLAAGVAILSVLLWCIHAIFEYSSTERLKSVTGHVHGPSRSSFGSTPSLGGKEAHRPTGGSYSNDFSRDPTLPTQAPLMLKRGSAPSRIRRTWLRFRPKGEAGAFHAAALYGNLLRLILLFHLPITIFSIYQLVLGSRASIVSRVFAALSLAFISILIPAGVMLKISRTPSGKLYDATRTLLSLGPMYNVYVQEKQMFRVFPLIASLITGVIIGAGQGSGIVQAVILVVVELAMLILPAVWYPWGEGASMGAPCTFLGIVRVASMVLVMILSPTVSSLLANPANSQLALTDSTNDWVAYAILTLQAIVFLFFILMLLTKMVEGFIRLFGAAHFDESTHPLDGGLFAAIMDLDCLNGVRGGKAAARRRRKHGSKQLQRNVSAVGSLSTQMMLDRHSQGVARVPNSTGDAPFEVDEPDLFPIYQPPLGPPPSERRSWETRSDDPSTGNIMDAWRTSASLAGYVAPGMSNASEMSLPSPDERGDSTPHTFTVIRGGRADYNNPYAVADRPNDSRTLASEPIRISQINARSVTPQHTRQQSSSALIEVTDEPIVASTSTVSLATNPSGLRLNNEGLRPPVLAIPKRRSLNNLKDEQDLSPGSKYSHSSDVRKGKHRSKAMGWFSKAEPGSDESDDEPGPSRRKYRKTSRDFEPIVTLPEMERKSLLRSALGIRRKKSLDAIAEQARDENKARKAILAAESGALFAGVVAPTPPPRKKAFVVHRRSETPSEPPTGTIVSDRLAPPFFNVKRSSQLAPSPLPTAPTRLKSDTSRGSASPAPAITQPPIRSFKVIRPDIPSPSAGSFVVDRPVSSSNLPQTRPMQGGDIGYSSSAFVPMSQTGRRV